METTHKLAHLLPHWIEHNDSHGLQFEEWAGKAREAGLDRVADEIAAAAEAVRAANARLEAARSALAEPGAAGGD